MSGKTESAMSGVDKYDKTELKTSVTSGAMAAYKRHPEHFEGCDTVNDVGSEVTKLLDLAIRHGDELTQVAELRDSLDGAREAIQESRVEYVRMHRKLKETLQSLNAARGEIAKLQKSVKELEEDDDVMRYCAYYVANEYEKLVQGSWVDRVCVSPEPHKGLRQVYRDLGFDWKNLDANWRRLN